MSQFTSGGQSVEGSKEDAKPEENISTEIIHAHFRARSLNWPCSRHGQNATEIKPVNPKGSQPSVLIGRTGAEAETPVF